MSATWGPRIKIPCVLMRGGTSRGPFFLASDLPADRNERDQMLLKIMGCPQFLRVDGIAGMDTVTSKLAVISPSLRGDADVDYLFGQADPRLERLDYKANCGNLISAVAPFAIDAGLVEIRQPETVVRIHNVNTGVMVHAIVQTPRARVEYEGDCSIDGVPGTGAPIRLNFLDAVGAKTGRLFPTRVRSEICEGVTVSCLDVGVPVVFVAAADLGKTGSECAASLSRDVELMKRLEAIRLRAGERMGLGDCRGSVIPKICLVSPPRNGGAIQSRYFTPTTCHPTHAVTGALCLAVATSLAGTVPYAQTDRTRTQGWNAGMVRIEHPSGTITASLKIEADGDEVRVPEAAFVRTADRLFEGNALVQAPPPVAVPTAEAFLHGIA